MPTKQYGGSWYHTPFLVTDNAYVPYQSNTELQFDAPSTVQFLFNGALPVPPNDNGPPPPWPYHAPPDQVVPPYGRPAPEAPPAPPAPPADGGQQPLPAEAPLAWGHHPLEGQGDGPSIATYEQNGKFVDPSGGTGVYAPGTDKPPAENWVDLMLAPRQA